MTHTLIPRSGTCSAKVVSSTDFEKYWSSDVLANYIKSGFTITAQCPAALDADVSTGVARVNGLYVENTIADTTGALTACTDNYVYLQINRDCCCKPKSWTYTINTTGVKVTDAFMIGKLTTNDTTVTTVCQTMADTSIQYLIEAKTGCCHKITVHSTTLCDYTSPSTAVGTSEFCCHACVCWHDNGESYADQCAYDAAWASTDTANKRGNPCDDRINFSVISDNTDNFICHDMSSHVCGCTISDTSWVLRFRAQVTASGSNPDITFGFTCKSSATASTCASHDAVAFRVTGASFGCTNNISGQSTCFSGHATTNCESRSCATPWDICACGDGYYWEITRLTATTGRVRVYNDVEYSCQQGCDFCFTIDCGASVTGLRYFRIAERVICNSTSATIQFDCFIFWDGVTTAGSYTPRKFDDNAVDSCTSTRWVSDSESNPAIYADLGACFCDNVVGIMINPHADSCVSLLKVRVSADTCFTDSENVRTITYSCLTECSNNFYRFNPTTGRYVQIYSADSGNSKIALNEVRILTKTDAQRDAEFGYYTINPNNSSLSGNGLPP